MGDKWTRQGMEWLTALQNSDGGWGYYPGGTSFAEPTVLSCLALKNGDRLEVEAPSKIKVGRAATWLAEAQHPQGSLAVTPETPEATWPTAYAILLWAHLDGFADASRLAVNWLLNHEGRALSRAGIYGHDVTLVGWPWIDGTHSWLEPTAVAIMALRRSNYLDHPRTQNGIKLIVDRQIEGGGWNYGNKSVFGKDLRPQPAPTGQALLALANLEVARRAAMPSCSYLQRTLNETRSPVSLSWGILGLTAWNERPEEAGLWLEESFGTVHEKGNTTMALACLLLAASSESNILPTTE